MKKAMVILASIAMVVMISGTSLAEGQGKGFYKGKQLTEAQIEQIKDARAKFMKDTLELRQKMAVKAVELKTLYAQPKRDEAKIKALAIELVDLRAAIAKKKIEAFSGLPVGPGYGRGGYGKVGCPGFGGGPGKGAGRGGFGRGGGYPPCGL
jgi:hypothetical protein